MDDDRPAAQGELGAWIAAHWAPESGDPERFLASLESKRTRRRVRSDALGVVALTAAALLFLASAPSVPDPGWLASTSLAEPSRPPLSPDLAVLRATFLPPRATP